MAARIDEQRRVAGLVQREVDVACRLGRHIELVAELAGKAYAHDPGVDAGHLRAVEHLAVMELDQHACRGRLLVAQEAALLGQGQMHARALHCGEGLDGAHQFTLERALWEHPHRAEWGEGFGGTWRAHVEYADTTCNFLGTPPAWLVNKVPAENRFVWNRGHFSVPLSMARNGAPLKPPGLHRPGLAAG